ncbi:MAG: hypothetical protein ABJJ05_03425 [Maribacter litoralis]|uniref:hypothetical protein n=1 Tax=Maribacter litoralis TaxID=2059726 RepID=UPI003299E150
MKIEDILDGINQNHELDISSLAINILVKNVENNVLLRYMLEEQIKIKLIAQGSSVSEPDVDENYNEAMEKLRPIIREELVQAFQDVIKK